MNRTADMRDELSSIEESDRAMARIAALETRKETAKARANQKIATIRADLQDRLSRIDEELAPLTRRITNFILRHLDLFQSPRKRKTESGSYGLQKVTEVDIEDEQALIDDLLDKGYHDCVEIIRRPVKSRIKDRLKDGERIRGCGLHQGDTAVYKVDPQLIREAKNVES